MRKTNDIHSLENTGLGGRTQLYLQLQNVVIFKHTHNQSKLYSCTCYTRSQTPKSFQTWKTCKKFTHSFLPDHLRRGCSHHQKPPWPEVIGCYSNQTILHNLVQSQLTLITLSVNKNFSRYGSHLLIWIFINANFDLRCSWQPAFARIDHTHPMERSIPKFTPKCKRVMLHAHSSLYLPPHNYTPCIKTPFFVKKKNLWKLTSKLLQSKTT